MSTPEHPGPPKKPNMPLPRRAPEGHICPPTSGQVRPPHVRSFTSPRLFTRRKHPWRLNQPTPPPRFFQFRVNAQAAKNPDIRGPPPTRFSRYGPGGMPLMTQPSCQFWNIRGRFSPVGVAQAELSSNSTQNERAWCKSFNPKW